ncbi:MAG: UDP-4-amino-4,6-dideoxy-N-acetyl-beta-L-altrosamine transaminase [Candidatus Margulisiibacteriota bacterium]
MKKIPYATQYIDDGDVLAVSRALKNDFLTQGPLVGEFEKKIAKYCGAKYAVAVNSGTSALHIACLAAGLKKGVEGITTPITFAASANCMLYCGAKPVFADVDPDTICIDPVEIENKITKKTRVIIPVHFAGHPCDMKKINAIAKKHKLTVIEDACHALGSKYYGEKIGSCRYSDMSVLSFHAVKHITTGEGGAVLTNNEKLYRKLVSLRTHGIVRDEAQAARIGAWYYEMRDLGYNYRITDFQCALGISQAKKLPAFIKKRKEIVNTYNKAFSKIPGISALKKQPWADPSYHIYVIRNDSAKTGVTRRALFDMLRKNNILVNVHYLPVYMHPYYQKSGYKNTSCKHAENYYGEAITLPLFPKMKKRDTDKVIKVLISAVKGNKKA